ncbi:MAG TPA: hypothetical protein GXZ28_00530 [Clostridiales bacterium]|nr:hypothetical protein [Clostridiales bacterium]
MSTARLNEKNNIPNNYEKNGGREGSFKKDMKETSRMQGNKQNYSSDEATYDDLVSMELEHLDKLETLKRIEREKKVKKRKMYEEEMERPKRPVVKQRRPAGKDWTKNYEYGLLDDDMDYFD